MFSSFFRRIGFVKSAVFVVILATGVSAFLMTGSAPSDDAVAADIKREIENSTEGKGHVTTLSIKTLDGWSDGVEFEVTYSLNATADSTVRSGILADLVLKSGTELRDGKIAASYQWDPNKKNWGLIRVSNVSLPR